MNKELHSQRGFLHGRLLKPQYSWFYNHGTHYRWWGHTSRGREMPRRGTHHGNGHDPAEVVDGSVPAVSAEPPAGTSSPANAVLTTFRRLGSGGEEEGLQHRQSKHPTTTRLDNSTRQRSHTWWIRLHSLCACVPPDDPELPSTLGGSCSRLSHCWADHQTIEPFSLQLRRWREGVTIGGCQIVADNSDTTPCVPAEDS
jgi:hypothetical protein